MSNLSWMTFSVLLGSVFLYSYRKSKEVHDEQNYLFANRKTNLFSLIATLVMTEFNTTTLVSFSGLGFVAGLWGLSLPFIFLFGLGFYALSVAKKWKEYDGVSIVGFFRSKYGSKMARFAGLILFVAMALFSSTYVKSLTLLFTPLFQDMNEPLLGFFLVLAVVIFMVRGGLISVIQVDVLSFLITLIFIPVMVYYTYQLVPFNSSILDTNALESSLNVIPASFVLSLIVLTMFTYILAPWYSQKIFSAACPRTAYIAVLIASLVVFFLYSMGVLSCYFFSFTDVKLVNPELALPFIIHSILPESFKGIAYAVLFLIATTTLTGVWSAMTTIIVDEISSTLKNQVTRGIILTLSCALLSYVLGMTIVSKVFKYMILANIPIAALSFALLGGFYWSKVSTIGVSISIVLGLSAGLGSFLYFGEEGNYTIYWAFIGIPLIFGGGILGSLLFPPVDTAKV